MARKKRWSKERRARFEATVRARNAHADKMLRLAPPEQPPTPPAPPAPARVAYRIELRTNLDFKNVVRAAAGLLLLVARISDGQAQAVAYADDWFAGRDELQYPD